MSDAGGRLAIWFPRCREALWRCKAVCPGRRVTTDRIVPHEALQRTRPPERGRAAELGRSAAGWIWGDDLAEMSPEQLAAEVRRLRAGFRRHRDSTGHELCWHHPALWGLLPEASDPVPAWPEFLRGCVQYRQSLDLQAAGAPRTPEEASGGGGL